MKAIRATRAFGLMLCCWACAGCFNGFGSCGPNPQFGLFCCPSCPEFVPKTCAELNATQFHWSLRGFSSGDILNPDTRDQPELTAIMHVGDVKALKVSAGTTDTSEDCSDKASSVEWSVSSRRVASLEIEDGGRAARLTTLKPGDTIVAATLHFQDGTPSMRVLPWSFTNVSSGDVTVVRVVP